MRGALEVEDNTISALSQTASGPSTVSYDGDCPLYRPEIALYRGLDGAGAIDLVDVRSRDAPLPEWLSRDAAFSRFHVRTADGEILSGAAVETGARVAFCRRDTSGRSPFCDASHA